MDVQTNFEQFNIIYDKTYREVLRYVTCRVANINDVNDILQDTYIELYKITQKKYLVMTNISAYVKAIANNKIMKYYFLNKKAQNISLYEKVTEDIEVIDTTIDMTVIEDVEKILDSIDCDRIWSYIKTKRPIISKFFCLYYSCEFSIKEIAHELSIGESYVKNCIYRTLKDLENVFRKGSDKYEL